MVEENKNTDKPFVVPDDELVIFKKFRSYNSISPDYYSRYDVKRGLRNADGTGVLAGLTRVANVHGYVFSDDEKMPDEGRLNYRGYNLYELLDTNDDDRRFNYEEISYLLLMGELPSQQKLERFIKSLDHYRELPDGFTASVIMRETSPNIMNMLQRTVLTLYSDDPMAESRDPRHEILVAISLISRLPRIAVLSYYSEKARYAGESMFIHPFIQGQSSAETILSSLRPNREFTQAEARVLDIMLCLHAEHGGGNNSSFVARALTSADTDPYSAYAAAIGSLKGRRHGGANLLTLAMQQNIKENVSNWQDDGALVDYLTKIVHREANDKTGLIYGMGHAVYTLSDPRAVICKVFAEKLTKGTEFEEDFRLLEAIERLSPEVLAREKNITKDICANIDLYSGLVYSALGIPKELFTPLFACARMSGWAAHRFEEMVSGRRIMRPAYKGIARGDLHPLPMDQRQ